MGLEETPWNDNVANIVMVHDYAGCSCGWCHENETIKVETPMTDNDPITDK